ncbi:HesA/MoeB/ThiF family protein [Nonomuraea angiospora]|uniref:HesA/MoeB/ThiF family protein n=1 Tax=Nonomuraea angiospora TaxID=46172 RepID=UPI0029BE1AD3|nr:ThiF family adenylyltransferase [Nonomuraea angiospora]MDX3106896.1 ThiF family adenylyltransferase [Nonomuraea angiospora]
MNSLIILVPQEASARIRSSGAWGMVTFKVSDAENAGYVYQVTSGETTTLLPVAIKPERTHFLISGDSRRGGMWYRVGAELHGLWYISRRSDTSLTIDAFKAFITSGFKNPGETGQIAITYAPDAAERFPDVQVPDLAAWHITREAVTPLDAECEPPVYGNAQLSSHWPVEDLARTTVVIVGLGSIGGATAHALASYGVGRLILIDPDRLRWSNLVRHVSGPAHVGQLKVSAIRADLELLRPGTEVVSYPIDVVVNADLVRPLLTLSDLVVCTADGVAPRRVISHLARRARIDAILACVLEDGGLGELLRLRPWNDRGCLVCQRQALRDAGGIDPEPAIDAGYGTGTLHRPMTAVGGDLHLVGQLAAKAAVSTILERNGWADQKLPGEHAIFSLRPQPDWAAPFDLNRAGDFRWRPATPPITGCPTCGEP